MGTSPWWVYEASTGMWKHRDGRTVAPGTGPDPELPPLFAGHKPFQVRFGMNSAENAANPLTPPRPQYDEAVTILGGHARLNVRRVFDFSNGISTNMANQMVEEPDQQVDCLPVMSFKVAGDDWDGVYAGAHDAELTTLRNWAIARRAAGKGPVLCGFHHEPNSDGPTADNLVNMQHWGRMQLYALNFMTGWATRGITNTGGTYNAAQDVRDILAWAPIANGFWWGTKFPHDDLIAAAYTPTLIAAFNDRGGPLGADMYDPTNATYSRDANNDRIEASITFASNYDSCWREIQKMCTWARANNVKSIGFGEMGNVLLANWDKTADQLMANRDIISYACTFNNFQASKWDWRHIPANYGIYNETNSNGLVDYGGDALSAGYVSKFITMRDRCWTETTPF